MKFFHDSPDKFKILIPRTYNQLRELRGDNYPVEERRIRESKIKKNWDYPEVKHHLFAVHI